MEKKTILFDFLVFEDRIINGGALYAKTILFKLVERGVKIIGVCANKDGLNPEIADMARMSGIPVYEGIENVNQIIEKEHVSVFFIGIAQRYNRYDLTGVRCEVYIVCHDIADIAIEKANVAGIEYQTIFQKNYEGKRSFLGRIKAKLLYAYKVLRSLNTRRLVKTNAQIVRKLGYDNFSRLVTQKNVHLITDSDYSKNSIEFFFDGIANDILVFYSPEIERDLRDGEECVEEMRGRKFLLILACNRLNKNAYTFFESFKRLNEKRPGEYSVCAVGLDKPSEGSICCLKSVSDAKLIWLMKNCYALIYPSLNEGFGLPPLEAMSFSKPAIVAYDTSIPEVCGDGVLYFCPLYPDDLYMKINMLAERYDFYSQKGHERYIEIAEKRRNDTERMLDILVS